MKNKLILLIVGLLIVVGGGYYFLMADEPISENAEVIVDEISEEVADIVVKELSGTLSDITDGNASGVVQAIFENSEYKLRAAFADLPEPQGGDFYEGWVVRRGENFNFISTGKAVKVGSDYENHFNYDSDVTDHDFYVLTIEPDDGDPAPARHILEGELSS